MKPKNTPQPSGPNDNLVISPSMVWEYPLVIDRVKGLNIGDADRNRFLNFSAGVMMNVGGKHHVTLTGVTILNRSFAVIEG